jgi:anti-sigma regulatory factor (Ser/Thr protein kinase)
VSDRVEIEVELPREKAAPHMARNALRRACADRVETEVLVAAELLVSELATNALLHGRGNIKLRAAIDAQRVWAAMIDEGGGFGESLRRRECDQIGGWGAGPRRRPLQRLGHREQLAGVVRTAASRSLALSRSSLPRRRAC